MNMRKIIVGIPCMVIQMSLASGQDPDNPLSDNDPIVMNKVPDFRSADAKEIEEEGGLTILGNMFTAMLVMNLLFVVYCYYKERQRRAETARKKYHSVSGDEQQCLAVESNGTSNPDHYQYQSDHENNSNDAGSENENGDINKDDSNDSNDVQAGLLPCEDKGSENNSFVVVDVEQEDSGSYE